MGEFWIPGVNEHRFWWFCFSGHLLPSFLFRLRRYIKQSRECLNPNTSNFVKNTSLPTIFSILFSVFGYPAETLSLVVDILHEEYFFCYSTFRACQSGLAEIGYILEASKWSFIGWNLSETISGKTVGRSSNACETKGGTLLIYIH